MPLDTPPRLPMVSAQHGLISIIYNLILEGLKFVPLKHWLRHVENCNEASTWAS